LKAAAKVAIPAWALGARPLFTSIAVNLRPALTTKSTSRLRSRQ
jgi:hypothetical protein